MADWARERAEKLIETASPQTVAALYDAVAQALREARAEGIEAALKIAERERRRWSVPCGASRTSQQMQEYARQACRNIRDDLKKAHAGTENTK